MYGCFHFCRTPKNSITAVMAKPIRFLWVFFVSLVTFTFAPSASTIDNQEFGKPHSFSWEVSDELSQNFYSHREVSDGQVTTGSYRVLLPDGRTQTVTYKADENGYSAQVNYEGGNIVNLTPSSLSYNHHSNLEAVASESILQQTIPVPSNQLHSSERLPVPLAFRLRRTSPSISP